MHINTKNAGFLIADSCLYGVKPFGMPETSKLKEYESKIVNMTIMLFCQPEHYLRLFLTFCRKLNETNWVIQFILINRICILNETVQTTKKGSMRQILEHIRHVRPIHLTALPVRVVPYSYYFPISAQFKTYSWNSTVSFNLRLSLRFQSHSICMNRLKFHACWQMP